MHHGDVPFAKIMVPWLVGQIMGERNKGPDLIEANASWAPWAHGCLEAKKSESNLGTAMMSMECSNSRSDFGVEPHDATNAYLSTKHDVAEQATNDLVLKEIDEYYFDQRISFAVVAVGGAEGNIDVLVKSGIWPGDFCAPRIFVKAMCSAFQPEQKALEKTERLHALHVERCPTTKGTSVGTTGSVDDFACHLVGAGVCESDRWRPPAAT